MEYCYYVLAGALNCYLGILEKIQKQVYCAPGPTFADLIVLQKIIVIEMWSLFISFIGTFLGDAPLAN